MSSKVLLVEGDSDKSFFVEVFKKINLLDVDVKINTPRDCGADKDGKKSGIKLIEGLIEQLNDGTITHLAMVIDADYAGNGNTWGYSTTFTAVKNRLVTSKYTEPDTSLPRLIFPHLDGLPSFGLWIMPDNKSEGMFEDWIIQAVKEEESLLLKHAMDTLKTLPQPQRFKAIHKSKAEIATWMAWQKNPGEKLHAVIENNLIDMEFLLAKELVSWLKHVYC